MFLKHYGHKLCACRLPHGLGCLSLPQRQHMGSALENWKGKRLLAERGDQVFEVISSIQVPTPQLKLTQIPSSGFVNTKRTIKNIITGFCRTRWGNLVEKKKKIWARISACSMVKGAVVGMLLNLWPRKDSFFFFFALTLGLAVLCLWEYYHVLRH